MPDPKIKSKDLSYSASLPPFLQRLHAQKAGRVEDEDKHEHAVPRPQRLTTAADEEGDQPTVVDERGEVVDLTRIEDGEGERKTEEKGDADKQEDKDVEKTAVADGVTVGGRKRKVGKVIGEGDEKEEESSNAPTKERKSKQGKKKAKQIKLAFDEENDEGT